MTAAFIIPNMEFVAKTNTLCFYSAIHDLMNFYQVPLSHNDLFFLGNGMDISYKSDLNFIGYLEFNKTLDNLVKALPFPITYQYRSNSGPELSAQAHDLLHQGHPVLLLVGTAHLTFHPAFHELNSDNRGHCVILYGEDVQDHLAYIGDAYFRDSTGQTITFQGAVHRREIDESIFGFLGFRPNQGVLIPRSFIIKKAVENTCAFLKGRIEGDYYYGNLAIKQFVSDLEQLLGYEGERLNQTCHNIHFNLKVRSIFNIIAGYTHFLQAHSLSSQPRGEDLIDRFEQVKKTWDFIGLSIVKMGITQRKSSLAQIKENCDKLIQQQDEALQRFIESFEAIV